MEEVGGQEEVLPQSSIRQYSQYQEPKDRGGALLLQQESPNPPSSLSYLVWLLTESPSQPF